MAIEPTAPARSRRAGSPPTARSPPPTPPSRPPPRRGTFSRPRPDRRTRSSHRRRPRRPRRRATARAPARPPHTAPPPAAPACSLSPRSAPHRRTPGDYSPRAGPEGRAGTGPMVPPEAARLLVRCRWPRGSARFRVEVGGVRDRRLAAGIRCARASTEGRGDCAFAGFVERRGPRVRLHGYGVSFRATRRVPDSDGSMTGWPWSLSRGNLAERPRARRERDELGRQ